MLYNEKFIIIKQEKTPDNMGGYNSEPYEVGTFQASTIPLAMDFQLSENANNISESRRLITEDKLPINFQETRELFTLKEKVTGFNYSVLAVSDLGKETVLLLRRGNK